jgi:hypothetical protein
LINRQTTFKDRLFIKIRQHIKGKRVGFLLGAGSSFLDGNGYPLAAGLWPAIKTRMTDEEQKLIEAQITAGSSTLEQALDAIDHGRDEDLDLRHRITSSIAAAFLSRKPPLDYHRQFVARLAKRRERRIPVFTLNYDTLVELAADREEVNLVDGFCGIVESYFQPYCFDDFRGIIESRRGRSVPVPVRGIINLYKLHGSLGWFADDESRLLRIRPDIQCSPGWKHLMVPPQNRKAADTGITPYATIWSEFRSYLANEATRLVNRLVCIGYGFGDGHVNAVIRSALARRNFTLVILTKFLEEVKFKQWRDYSNTIIITEGKSSLYGEEGPGLPDSCAFEWLAMEV